MFRQSVETSQGKSLPLQFQTLISLWRPPGKSHIGIVCSLLRHCLQQGMHITRSVITCWLCTMYNHAQLCELVVQSYHIFPTSTEAGSSFRWKSQALPSVDAAWDAFLVFSVIHFSSWSDKAHPNHPQETTDSKAAPRLYQGCLCWGQVLEGLYDWVCIFSI